MDYRWSEQWGFGLDGGWSQNGQATEGAVFDLGSGDTRSVNRDRFSTWQIGTHAVYFLPARASLPIKWYALGGGGFYGVTRKVTETLTIGGGAPAPERTITGNGAGLMSATVD